ncbi:hypothetical protein T492DRAFT_861580 [Pavlovales sp. CCMP2436]|nr:hypothetical protein T492DRAFT_861580 [Pavlovales sp. CCMP2436]
MCQKLMRYVLPSPHTPRDGDTAAVPPPEPTCDLLATRQLGETVYALKTQLARDGVRVPDDCDERPVLAQYNELFSLPWKRDNELWLPVEL